MNKPRRKFLQVGALLGVGAAFLPLDFASAAKMGINEPAKAKLSKFGIQLYSVKEEMAKDAAGTMRKLAGFGYKQLEGFDGGKGILWGMNPSECKMLLSDIGVDFISSHANVFKDLDAQAEQAAEVGMKYLICPYIGAQKSVDEWKKVADKFNAAGETLRSHGLKFAYHNHDYTFKMLEGQLPQDILMENTDPDLVDFELDMYWAFVAGYDPLEYIAKFPERFKLCHVKDAEAAGGNAHDRGVLLGSGEMPYADLIKKSKKYGMKYFIVEQERFVGTNPMEAAEKNAAYLAKLKI
ncbi:sugar phosphate isomerase/epimerase family protein [Algoriphagus persicinus]|uniref:sugar phosphate isomerase/epimerase family protein n=1 Tax=Algoriphagus persicinus TaxID=3108754 RepID=UPI002B3D3EDE|nr:sugar phosphate isomerase/epimerase [Algoriphagus sp. E1-3-M2]MEB2786483.1 sugar phosphate isomerase/epimerase [Algoriphagus sp. E1-3-M2]